MIKVLVFIALLCGFGREALALESGPVLNGMAAAIIEGHIRPGYARLFQASDQLKLKMKNYCAARAGAGQQAGAGKLSQLEPLRQAFGTTVLAFAAIEHIHFGPMMEQYRRERLYYWPDRKGRGARAVRKLLAGQDRAALDQATFAKKSVAVQGLSALELLLHARGKEALLKTGDEGTFACAYGIAIVENIHRISAEMVGEWAVTGTISQYLMNPKPDHAHYRTSKEVVSTFYQAITSGFQMLHDLNLLPLPGTDSQHAKPKRAAFWRSGLAIAYIRAKFNGLMAFVRVSGFIDLLPKDGVDLRAHVNRVENEISQIFSGFKDAGKTRQIAAILTTPRSRADFEQLTKHVSHLNAGFARQFAVAADLPLGFNASDGD